MAERRRGIFWQDEEERLLEVLNEVDSGHRVMPSTHFLNITLFNKAARRPTGWVWGVQRTSEQCSAKLKHMKSAFFEDLEHF